MKKLLLASWFVCKHGIRWVYSYVVWSLWLFLAVLFVFQLKIALSRELNIPAWILHRLENKHAARGLIAHFGAATVDPRGRVLLRDARLRSVNYPEPLFTARSIEFTLNPWAVLVGDFGASDVQLHGGKLHLPPILSPSGRDEPILTDLDFSLEVADRELIVNRLTARYAGLTISARGTHSLPEAKDGARLDPDKMVDTVVNTYLKAAAQLAIQIPKVDWFDTPHLDLVLRAHPDRGAVAHVNFTATGARIPASLVPRLPAKGFIDLGPLALNTTLPLIHNQSWAARIQLSLAELTAPGELHATDARLTLLTGLQPGWKPVPRSIDLSFARLSFGEFSAQAVSARLSGSYPQIHAEVGLRSLDEPWTLSADTDWSVRSGTVEVASKISPVVIAQLSRKIGRDLSALIKLGDRAPFSLKANFVPGWKLAEARGHVSTGFVDARRVAISAASADFFYAGSALSVERIVLKTPDSEARGSYAMDTKTNDFRFLLAGALRPPDIAGWFGDWWPNFWKHFDFSASSPPRADIDISGQWGKPYDTVIFLHADATSPVIRTVPFDHVRTTLFIRPSFYDGLELVATRGGGLARGTFTRSVDFQKNALNYQSFDVTTDLDLREAARIFGATGTDIVDPFIFQRPPKVTAVGRLTGPASPEGVHERAKIKVESNGPFTFMGFPLSNLSASAVLNDDDLQLDGLRVGFAQGFVTGRARLSGRGDQRRLGFDAALENGSLGQAIQTLEEFGAARKKQPAPPRSKFQERLTSGRLNLRVSGDGNYRDPYSFIGGGSGEISGAALAQINLLGGLSEVLRAVRLNFTSLRLNSAQSNFKLNGPQLDFSELKITGPSASIDLHGLYRLDLQQMDFNARVSPFELSKNPLASAVDLVLTPFTNILELKLSGSIDRPRWRFAYGPSSLLRSLSGKKDTMEEAATSPAPTPPASLQPPPSLRRR
jgi:hypothetical protein